MTCHWLESKTHIFYYYYFLKISNADFKALKIIKLRETGAEKPEKPSEKINNYFFSLFKKKRNIVFEDLRRLRALFIFKIIKKQPHISGEKSAGSGSLKIARKSDFFFENLGGTERSKFFLKNLFFLLFWGSKNQRILNR